MKKQKYCGVELKFTIGDWVEFDKETTFYTDWPNRRSNVEGLGSSKVGQVCGVKLRKTGSMEEDNEYDEYGGRNSSWVNFVTNQQHVLYEVKIGLTNKTYLVAPKDATIATEHPNKLPLRDGGWTDDLREDFKKQIKEHPELFPRDAKGRFIKYYGSN